MVTREPYEGHPLTKLVIPSVKLAHGAADGPSFVHQHLSVALTRRLIFLSLYLHHPVSVPLSRIHLPIQGTNYHTPLTVYNFSLATEPTLERRFRAPRISRTIDNPRWVLHVDTFNKFYTVFE